MAEYVQNLWSALKENLILSLQDNWFTDFNGQHYWGITLLYVFMAAILVAYQSRNARLSRARNNVRFSAR